jgi:transposase-like protein
VQSSESRPALIRRARVSKDEEREIARLYAETATPISEIRERFGIGDGSLYRVLQRLGVAVRGRAASIRQQNPPQAQTPASGRLRDASANQAQRAVSRQTTAATTAAAKRGVDKRSGRRPMRGASVTQAAPLSSGVVATQTGGDRHRFRIRFLGESVVEATDMRDALRKAKSFGAIEITAVSRED